MLFHTAANLLNDCYDFRRGLDRQVNPASGAVVRGWLTDRQAFRAALLCLVLGIACGLVLVRLAGWPVLALGLAGTLLVLGYTRAGFCLKFAGLGDLAIFAAFGALPVLGAWWVQTERFAWPPVLWSLPMVSYTVGILHANNWRDIDSDAARGCRPFAVRLGPRGSQRYYRFLMLAPFLFVAAALLLDRFTPLPIRAPLPLLLVFLALPLAARLALTDWNRHPDTFVMLDAKTAQMHLLFGILLTAGFLLAGRTVGLN